MAFDARAPRALRRALVATGLAALTTLASCSSSTTTPTKRYYVSLGDSYSVGFQPSPLPRATGGYTAVVAQDTHLVLENFGCAGATTQSILYTAGCNEITASSRRAPYTSQAQATAAIDFIEQHKGEIGLITVSIGGNDVTQCATSSNPISCVVSAVSIIKTDVSKLASMLRKAAGAGVPIIGLTYPDVILGEWVFPKGSPDVSLATLSVTAFKSYINPTLEQAYRSGDATLVDVTSATGAYTPLSETTSLSPYGTIPVAVAKVCELTWFCSLGNIHANTAGYTLIGKQIVAAYSGIEHH